MPLGQHDRGRAQGFFARAGTGQSGVANLKNTNCSLPAARVTPRVVTTRDELRDAVARARRAGKTIGLVPTMGALHAGHLSLVEASCQECDFTLVTIFVNPTQFGPHEDFRRYPRSLEADLEALSAYAVDVVFAPPDGEMYAPGHATFVEVEGVANPLEGTFRPGHFRGVATIVTKLFNLVLPDMAYFGRKDYQQSLVVKQLVRDLDLPITIRVCPIVREADGLALSSRNVYLSAEERRRALTLSQSLARAADLVAGGERDAATILAEMHKLFDAAGGIEIDYLVVADPDTLAEVSRVKGPVVAAVAAHVGKTRLIDNRLIEPDA